MYNYTWRIPLAFISPCQFPFSTPLYPLLLTWNPPSCDRNRPPRSQVAPLSKFPEPQLPRISLRRPREYSGFFCPEQGVTVACGLTAACNWLLPVVCQML
jgi:hypothetical protein